MQANGGRRFGNVQLFKHSYDGGKSLGVEEPGEKILSGCWSYVKMPILYGCCWKEWWSCSPCMWPYRMPGVPPESKSSCILITVWYSISLSSSSLWLLRFPFFGSWDINSNLAQNAMSIAGFIRGACLSPSVQQFASLQYWNGSCRCKRAQGSPSVQLAANLSVRILAWVQITTSANRWVKGKKQRRTLSIHLLHGNRNLQQSEQVYRSTNLVKP